MSLSKWDNRFINLAVHVASWSKDPSTRVAAVIVDKKNRVVSLGFNGYARGVDDTFHSREQKLMRVIHAEENALSFANRDVEGCTVYITHAPCSHCAALLIQHGIARVVYPSPQSGFSERWRESYIEALQMFHEVQIDLEVV